MSLETQMGLIVMILPMLEFDKDGGERSTPISAALSMVKRPFAHRTSWGASSIALDGCGCGEEKISCHHRGSNPEPSRP